MKLEWPILIAISLVAGTVFWFFVPPQTTAALAWVSLFSGFLFTAYVVVSGRQAKRLRLTERGIEVLETHQDRVTALTGFILIGVIGIEVAVRKAGGLWGNPWFIAFHLVLVLAMATTFVLARFRYTGLREPMHHWKLVYPFIVFYGLTLITGSILLEDKFHFYGSAPQNAAIQK